MGLESSAQWLESALMELANKMETGIELDEEIISGLVSFCEMASPLDAKEYLDNIVGEEVGRSVTEEYLKRRGHTNIYKTSSSSSGGTSTSSMQAYIKPPSDEGSVIKFTAKKSQRAPKEGVPPSGRDTQVKNGTATQDTRTTNQVGSRKKKSGKVVSLAEAAKGSIVFQKGKPCSCQARQHILVSNCLSCGKIVCEQEGEGPCNFCGALVLKEGSSYAGLEQGLSLVTEAEAAAEAYTKRLVEYDRNAAARTTVIDDQSDYYEMEGNSWFSKEEKELLRKKREEIEEAEQAKRNKVVMTFDLLGRKVLLKEDEAAEEMQNRILLRPPEKREEIRIKPNPNLKIHPIFIDPGPRKDAGDRAMSKGRSSGLCLEISGRVQHDRKEVVDIL